MNDFEKYAEESEKFIQLVNMEKHLCGARKDILPTNNSGDVLVTLVFVKPEMQMQLDGLRAELKELRRKSRKRMGPMMIMGGAPGDDREEELEREIADIEEKMSLLNVTAPLDTLYANQMLDVLIRAVQEEKTAVKQTLVPLVDKIGLK